MKKTKVLIVDDEHSFTTVVKMNLEATGRYEVAVENNSINAASLARSVEPDVVLLDIVMPAMDGGDVLAQFKKDAGLSGIPIIVLTALASPNDGNPVHSGGETVLAKPVTSDKLIRCIEDKLAGRI